LSRAKIITLEKLGKKIPALKAAGKKIVFTNGCFDILHYGHVQYLEKARDAGDVLVVAVNSDASIRRIKGHGRPIVRQGDRLRVLAGLESVDYAVLFEENTPLKAIKMIRPDVLVKGSDWNKNKIVGADIVSGYGGKVITIKLAKGRSTTKLIEKIAKSYGKQ
jgi:rfaE bifunctional protein nucleotidyltransferase chain/domain